MKEIKKMDLSVNSIKRFKEVVSQAIGPLMEEMTIIGLDHLKVSIDINHITPGKTIGVKISGFRSEKCELLYDENEV